jgi:hypothetical protein
MKPVHIGAFNPRESFGCNKANSAQRPINFSAVATPSIDPVRYAGFFFPVAGGAIFHTIEVIMEISPTGDLRDLVRRVQGQSDLISVVFGGGGEGWIR